MGTPKYQRILLKLSGEALSSEKAGILDFDFISVVARQIKNVWTQAFKLRFWSVQEIFGVADRERAWSIAEPITWACLLPLSTP